MVTIFPVLKQNVGMLYVVDTSLQILGFWYLHLLQKRLHKNLQKDLHLLQKKVILFKNAVLLKSKFQFILRG